jgi:Phytanoyl-CoA dioxygenase (PhyH)
VPWRVRSKRPSRRAGEPQLTTGSGPDVALAEARRLAKSNRHLDAIQLLTEANRLSRDRRVERRLVELRRDAFRRIRWPRPQPPWPDQNEDLFPGALVPEVGRAQLDVEALRSSIRNHGSLLVRGLVDLDDVGLLIRDIDTTFAAFDARVEGVRRADLDGWYVPFEMHAHTDEDRMRKRRGGAVLGVEAPPTFFDLIEVLNKAGVGHLAREYFGERPATLARKVTVRRMRHDASGGWHQDGAFMGEGIRSLNVWLALTHCGDDSPSLDVVGRHLDTIVPTGGGSKKYAISNEAAQRVGAGTIVRPIFEPGDALIFDHLCLHRTGKDPGMVNGRYAIETWLMAPSTYSAMTARVRNGHQPRDQIPLVY